MVKWFEASWKSVTQSVAYSERFLQAVKAQTPLAHFFRLAGRNMR